MVDVQKSIRIQQLNDELRTKGSARNGRVVAAGRLAREPEKHSAVIAAAYGEHDFGKVVLAGKGIIWKIDYYSLDEMHGAEHPDDPNTTIRVLTVMFAEDY